MIPALSLFGTHQRGFNSIPKFYKTFVFKRNSYNSNHKKLHPEVRMAKP